MGVTTTATTATTPTTPKEKKRVLLEFGSLFVAASGSCLVSRVGGATDATTESQAVDLFNDDDGNGRMNTGEPSRTRNAAARAGGGGGRRRSHYCTRLTSPSHFAAVVVEMVDSNKKCPRGSLSIRAPDAPVRPTSLAIRPAEFKGQSSSVSEEVSAPPTNLAGAEGERGPFLSLVIVPEKVEHPVVQSGGDQPSVGRSLASLATRPLPGAESKDPSSDVNKAEGERGPFLPLVIVPERVEHPVVESGDPSSLQGFYQFLSEAQTAVNKGLRRQCQDWDATPVDDKDMCKRRRLALMNFDVTIREYFSAVKSALEKVDKSSEAWKSSLKSSCESQENVLKLLDELQSAVSEADKLLLRIINADNNPRAVGYFQFFYTLLGRPETRITHPSAKGEGDMWKTLLRLLDLFGETFQRVRTATKFPTPTLEPVPPLVALPFSKKLQNPPTTIDTAQLGRLLDQYFSDVFDNIPATTPNIGASRREFLNPLNGFPFIPDRITM